MVNSICENCLKVFKQKCHMDKHKNRIKPCQKNNDIQLIIDMRVEEALKSIQDTGKFRTNKKDQFFTAPEIAKKCVDNIIKLLPETEDYRWIEPSAGNGSFMKQVPKKYDIIGMDIEPQDTNIILQDFLKYDFPTTNKKIIIFGNPPFGRQASMAKSFIKKSCEVAEIIAFILPKSFTKPSMNNSFHLSFHCIYTEILPKNSFLINDDVYDVPCVFQIWQKKSYNRTLDDKILPYKFKYVKSSNDYDIAFKRVGGLAGKCCIDKNCNIQSHYFIKFDDELKKYINKIIEKINNHTFPTNTTGPRSLSKNEINVVFNKTILEVSS
jgi:hypothetical protein